jgi:phage tail-like protein
MAYPHRNFRFRVEIDGISVASFSEVSGFDATFDVIEYRTGDAPITPRKLSGLVKYGNVTLKWGASDSLELYEWIQGQVEGEVERKTVTIIAMDEAGEDAASWQLVEAWPVKYTAPDFNGLGSEIALETLELAHEGLTRVQ